jgi:hypothetical protein
LIDYVHGLKYHIRQKLLQFKVKLSFGMMGERFKMSCAVLQLIRGQDSGCSRSGGWQEAQEGQQLGFFLMLCAFYGSS